MEDLGDTLKDLLIFLEKETQYAEENANLLHKQLGYSEEYKKERLKQYKIATHMLYDGYKYKILNVYDSGFVDSKQLGFRLKRKPFSGKIDSRFNRFAITSITDLKAILYKQIKDKKSRIDAIGEKNEQRTIYFNR